MRPDIDCPGDTVSYNCSILTNSETVQLEWRITLPGSILLLSMYDNPASLNNIDNLAMGVDTILTQYRSDTYIESIIIFTVLMGITFNQSNLQCRSANLDSMSTIVFVNTSGIKIIY